jgi:hypothetical protein
LALFERLATRYNCRRRDSMLGLLAFERRWQQDAAITSLATATEAGRLESVH